MSAFMIDREHVAYLVNAAFRYGCRRGSSFRWVHGEEVHGLEAGDLARAAEVGQMLWDANRESIEARYPDTRGNFFGNAPGPIGEDFEYSHKLTYRQFDPVQVIKACHCYEYQACEYGGWAASEACVFIQSLIGSACRELPGYEAAEWGAPADPAPVTAAKYSMRPRARR